MKILSQTALLMLLASVVLPALNCDAGECEKPKLESMTVTGRLVSVQQEKKAKDGEVTTETVYYVSTEDGKVQVPQPKAKKDSTPAFNLANFDGANVTIRAQGYMKKSCKGDKEEIHLDHITDIRRVDSPEA